MAVLDGPDLPPALPFADLNQTIKVDLNDSYFCSSALGGWVRPSKDKQFLFPFS